MSWKSIEIDHVNTNSKDKISLYKQSPKCVWEAMQVATRKTISSHLSLRNSLPSLQTYNAVKYHPFSIQQ